MNIRHASIVPLLIAMLGGCRYSIDHTPQDLASVSSTVPQFAVTNPVRVINGHKSSQSVIVETRSAELSVDYKQYTDAAVELFREALVAQQASVLHQADKSVTLSIINLTLTQSLMNVRATIEATVKLGNDSRRGFHAQSAGEVKSAIDEAMRQLVIQILSTEEVRAYLAE